MKKTIRLMILLVLACCVSCALAAAPGEEVTLDLTGETADAVFISLEYTYDHDVLEFVSINLADQVYGSKTDFSLTAARLSPVLSGKIGTITFRVKETALLGDYPIQVTLNEAYNKEEKAALFTLNDLQISVKDPVQSFVMRCYKLILNRDADAEGLQAWSKALKDQVAAASEIINGFVSSQEYINRNLSAGESVDILYKAMLDRPADEAGKAGWVDALNKGYTLQHIINGFCGSNEFAAICEVYDIEPGSVDVGSVNPEPADGTPRGYIESFVKRCYAILLERGVDPTGLKDWSDALESGAAQASQIIDGIVNSQEFQLRNLTNEQKVEVLYLAMLDRGPDPEGKAAWVQALAEGYPYAVIINGFCGSIEFGNICAEYHIQPGSVAVEGTLVKRVSIQPEGSDPAAPVIRAGYNSEYINEEKVRTFVKHCYESVLGREGDEEGIENYTSLILNGKKTPKKVAYEFVFSPEFQGRLPGNEEFIRILYRLYLNREPGAEELAGWVEMLEGGTNLDEIVKGFAEGAEFKAIVREMKE